MSGCVTEFYSFSRISYYLTRYAFNALLYYDIFEYKVNYHKKKAIHFAGYGRTNAMCSNDKVAVTINKEHGYYGSVLIAAHEMGHK